ncbi:hypothetical protein AMTR_s00096p00141170 [Amborella trichopoda]|uniref:Uncharacterized protein n=1 Tax=Amborella trichopoda TaxID=13333 RepID=W1NXS9_AMBTC|nr:hypothetical protein AMTR_s00096p00141170 [Amborella trichopoda]
MGVATKKIDGLVKGITQNVEAIASAQDVMAHILPVMMADKEQITTKYGRAILTASTNFEAVKDKLKKF